MELTKEEFCNIINMMDNNYQICSQINEILESSNKEMNYLHRDFFDANCLLGPYESTIIYLLEVLFEDEEKWIRYYCIEFEFGHSCFYDDYTVEVNGQLFNLNCAESLWNILHLTK